MRIRTTAPAKINWTLEVLGKRPDGYHEVSTVLQTIDLCDTVDVELARENRLEVTGDYAPGKDDLALQAARLVTQASGGGLSFAIRLTKRIPVAAGLGGGSSDGAAALRAIARLCGTADFDPYGVILDLGSDAPFFLHGGTALARGRGRQVKPLPDAPEAWLVVVAPPLVMEEKTKKMYEALRPEDFTDGRRTQAIAERLSRGERVRAQDMCNVFERAAYESFEGLADYRQRLLGAGAEGVHVAGAGPALFSLHETRREADHVAVRLGSGHGSVFVARTIGAAEATWLDTIGG